MPVIGIGIGFMMLIAGRPAYFVFVGGTAFLLGQYLAGQVALAPAAWNDLLAPAIFAAIGVLAALFFKRWAARAAGFFIGGWLVYNLPELFGPRPAWASEATAAAAGVMCVILLLLVFDVFLVFLSASAGATLVLSGTRFGGLNPVVMFLILLVFGVIAQYLLFEYGKPYPD